MITPINLKIARIALLATLLLTVFVAFQLVQPTTAEAVTVPTTLKFELEKKFSGPVPNGYTADQFSFNVSGHGAPVTLTKYIDDSANGFIELPLGTYTLSENGPVGFVASDWTVQWSGAGCEDLTGQSTTITVTQDDLDLPRDANGFSNFGCRADNQWKPDGDPDRGTIIIQKQTLPDGNTTAFTFNPSWSDVDFTLSDGAQYTQSGLAVGVHNVVETLATNWTQTSAVCTDGSPITAISLQADETVTCVITNAFDDDTDGDETGTIIIEKQTLPDGNTTAFTFNPSWSDVDFTLSDGAQHTESELPVGEYNIVETLATNWTQTSAVCSDGSPITAISLQANETVTCVITNTIDDGGENTVPKWLVFGYVWHDENENDAWDVEQQNPEDDESDLDGWTVQITNGSVIYSTTTDASGYYYFYVPAGTWTINEIIEEGWSKTFPNVNGHVVEVLGEVTFSEETHFFAKLMDFVVPTAYASVLPTTYGPYNFGNVQEDDGSSSGSDGSGPRRGSRRHSSNNNDDEPEGAVLGESTSIMPIGAPNTGAGGTAPHAVQFPILTAILPLSTSVRKVKNG